MKTDDFINEIKPMITIKESPYHKGKVHYMGATILTNKELDYMLETVFKEEYTQLSYSDRRRIRQRIFKECQNE